MSQTRYPTKLFVSYDEWALAGRPIGGIMPVDDSKDRDPNRTPPRYRGVAKWYVALPGGQLWCPWNRAYDREKGFHGDGWNITGGPACLTVTPSIKTDHYHGFLTNGVLVATPDSEL